MTAVQLALDLARTRIARDDRRHTLWESEVGLVELLDHRSARPRF
jgi:hypothetical protein